jgi:hypothetical protein
MDLHLIMVLIPYISDSKTFMILSQCSKRIYDVCIKNRNLLLFKHGPYMWLNELIVVYEYYWNNNKIHSVERNNNCGKKYGHETLILSKKIRYANLYTNIKKYDI